jgi:peptide chain release factor subunit 1
LYLDVDGRRFPRKQDYMVRAEQLGHQLHKQAERLPKRAAGSVARDGRRMMSFLDEMDRGPTRGVALFACSEAGLWEEVRVPRPLPDRAVVADHPHVLPLEALVETYETFCTVLVDRAKARIFPARMGQIREETDLFDDVPGQHDQGGWSQARYQRHIDEHVEKHLKHVADVLFRYFKRRGFDHLILAGPDEVVGEFEGCLHDYLRQRVVARLTLPMIATAAEVLARSLRVEEEVEARREREVVERVTAEAAAGRNGVLGLERVLGALNEGRVDTLVVPFGASAGGVRCPACGWLGAKGSRCPMCGRATEPVPDVVESAVAKALQQRSRVETLTMSEWNGKPPSDVGALLRF